MSLPWLLVAALPRLALWLPKPGHWMGRLRILLGLMMLGSSLWLTSLLDNHLGSYATGWLIVAMLLALLTGIIWRYGIRGFTLAIALATLIGSPLLLPQLHQIPGVGEQVARPRHDFHADRRHDEALVIPLHQLQVHHVLQGLDPGTQGRLADMAGLGGAVEILVLVQSDQILELLQAGPTLHRRNPIDAIYLI
jgi:hypothetical protein